MTTQDTVSIPSWLQISTPQLTDTTTIETPAITVESVPPLEISRAPEVVMTDFLKNVPEIPPQVETVEQNTVLETDPFALPSDTNTDPLHMKLLSNDKNESIPDWLKDTSSTEKTIANTSTSPSPEEE